MTTPTILLPFTDDSTLFFALRMRELLAPQNCRIVMGWLTDRSPLSYRQLQINLPEGPDILITNAAFKTPHLFESYAAIVTSRMYAPLRDMVKRRHVKMSARRPVVISFQGGLDFTPERGFDNRRHADAVFLVPARDVETYRAFAEAKQFDWQHVDFGHPTFTRMPAKTSGQGRRDVFFFAQAISPRTRRARQHVLDMLCAIARRDPSRDVFIKLRHLPGENEAHLHREKFSYASLLEQMRDPPANLKLTACPMPEAIAQAGLGITCTSTAAIDLIREGIPTQVYLDYVENYFDPLVGPMRKLFEGSDTIANLQELLDGTVRPPADDWMADMFCDMDLGARIMASIDIVRQGAIRVPELLPPPVIV